MIYATLTLTTKDVSEAHHQHDTECDCIQLIRLN